MNSSRAPKPSIHDLIAKESHLWSAIINEIRTLLKVKDKVSVDGLDQLTAQVKQYATVCISLSEKSPGQANTIISEMSELIEEFKRLRQSVIGISTPCQEASWRMEEAENYARSKLALMHCNQNDKNSAQEQLAKFTTQSRTNRWVKETTKAINLFSKPKQQPITDTTPRIVQPNSNRKSSF